MGKVIIKCFQTPLRKYFYDRFLGSVVAVNDQEYEILKEVEKNGQLPMDDSLKRFVDNGLLQETALEEIEHPEALEMKFLSEHYMENLVLQVTQQCNLRCKYCVYSGNYYNRTHSSERMSFETAKKAIDFYLERSDKADKLCLSFYGGEPFLEFELIKKCVDYITEKKGDRKVLYPITTNGTLLDQEKIEFLVKNDVALIISLDGAKESHDANRRFLSGEGTFDVIMKNLKALKEYDEDYFMNRVSYNCVISATTDLDSTYEFYANSDLFSPEQIYFTPVNSIDIKDKRILEITQKNQQKANFEYIKMLMSLLSKREWDSRSKMQRTRVSDMELMYERIHRHAPEGRATHHGGPCIPGVRRLFVETKGDFYPCERVSERNAQMCIGSLEKGFDYDRMDFFLNHGKLIKEECLNCWNIRECSYCLSGIEKKNRELTKETLLEQCRISKFRTEILLHGLCALVESGYKGNDNLKVVR